MRGPSPGAVSQVLCVFVEHGGKGLEPPAGSLQGSDWAGADELFSVFLHWWECFQGSHLSYETLSVDITKQKTHGQSEEHTVLAMPSPISEDSAVHLTGRAPQVRAQ